MGHASRLLWLKKHCPLGVTATGANVHDSRLTGATLKNSREMGSWFLGADVRHLCLDKGYDYPRVS